MRFSISTLSLLIIISFSSNSIEKESFSKEPIFEKKYEDLNKIELPNSIKMYESIEKYSTEYNVPSYIAYNLAYLETRYKGPFHWEYKHHQESYAGALGPMQIMPRTGDYLNGSSVDRFELMNNIDLNVRLSMKMLSNLYDKYGDWGIVCGYYNTGKPMVNNYGQYCRDNKDYRSKWIEIKKPS